VFIEVSSVSFVYISTISSSSFAVSAERLSLRGAAKAMEQPRIAHDITLE
jgi:hypothetical protein